MSITFLSTPPALTDRDRAALRALTRAGVAGYMTHEVAKRLGVSEGAARARMARLRARGLVEASYSLHGFAFYKLTREGRAAR